MKMKTLHWLLGATFLFVFSSSYGFAAVPNLYVGKAPLPSRSQANWNKAVDQAWIQVLKKVSGDQAIDSNTAVTDELKNVSKYVRSYSYQQQEDNANSPLMLKVKFDSKQVVGFLRKNSLPVWSDKRPVTLVWFAYMDNDAPKIVDAGDKSTFLSAFEQAGFNEGLPLVFPVMDLSDMANITPQDVYSLDPVSIDKASKRYQADDVLAGKLFQNYQGQWEANWMLMHDGEFQQWQTKGATAAANIAQVMGDLATSLAKQYASADSSDAKTQLTLNIDHVNGLNDYANVVKYLRGLSPVTSVNVAEVDGKTLVLDADVLGGVAALNKALAQGHKLYPETSNNDADTDVDAGATVLSYSWGVKPQPSTQMNNGPASWQFN